jgi:aromatic ring-cleaving dioxygenase
MPTPSPLAMSATLMENPFVTRPQPVSLLVTIPSLRPLDLQLMEMVLISTVRSPPAQVALANIYIVYYTKDEIEYARSLHERIRREFPELRIYQFWEKPVGPHPIPMFEVNVFTPHQTGAFFSFLAVHRGPLSWVKLPYLKPKLNASVPAS